MTELGRAMASIGLAFPPGSSGLVLIDVLLLLPTAVLALAAGTLSFPVQEVRSCGMLGYSWSLLCSW